MANRPNAGGFRWVYNKYAPEANSPPRVKLPIASAYGTSIPKGHPVKVIDGNVEAAAPGDAVYGVMDGMAQVYNATEGTVAPAASYVATVTWGTVLSRQSLAYVIPVRGQIFRATCDDAVTATTQALYEDTVQENVEWVAGSATGDQSGALLDISTNNTTNTLSVRIENVPDKEMTDFAAAGVELEVSFNLIQDTASGDTTGTTT